MMYRDTLGLDVGAMRPNLLERMAFCVLFLSGLFLIAPSCFGDGAGNWENGRSNRRDSANGFDVFNLFGNRYSAEMPKTQVIEVDENYNSKKQSISPTDNLNGQEDGVDPYGLLNNADNVFVSKNPASHLTDPDKDPRVRINPEAPGPFIGMALAHQQGKRELATRYAGQYVRYLVNLMYEVSELTRYVTDALVREKLVDDEEVMGVGQYLDIEFARSRKDSGAVIRPTHEHALQRIKADPKHEIFVYFLFSLSCQYCRDMAPDMERLWRVAKGDSRIKMAGLVLGDAPPAWLKSYREHTGLTMPIVPGAEIAKTFQIRFLPALVVISPNTNISYLKTGQLEFSRMYELIRTAQGLPKEMTPEVYKLAYQTKIGELEKTGKAKKIALSSKDSLVSGTSYIKGKVMGAQSVKADDLIELKKL